jgi:hypothetical protein
MTSRAIQRQVPAVFVEVNVGSPSKDLWSNVGTIQFSHDAPWENVMSMALLLAYAACFPFKPFKLIEL